MSAAISSVDDGPRHGSFSDSESNNLTENTLWRGLRSYSIRASKKMTRAFCEIFHKRVIFDVISGQITPLFVTADWPRFQSPTGVAGEMPPGCRPIPAPRPGECAQ